MIYVVGQQSTMFQENICTVEESLESLKVLKIVGTDSETSGLDCHSKELVMFQIGDKDNQFIIDTRYINIRNYKEILENSNIIKIGHNIKFDYKFLKKAGIELSNVYDTMLCEMVIDCGMDREKGYYSLEQLCLRYLNVKLDKSVRNQFIDLNGQPFTQKQIEYGAKDIEYLLDIRQLQLKTSKKMGLVEVVNLENKAVLAIGDIEYNGMLIDSQKWLKVAELTESNTLEHQKKLDAMVLTESKLSHLVPRNIQSNLFGFEERLLKINWSSSQQVLHILKALGLAVKSTDSRELKNFANKNSLVKELINYKKQAKLAESFGKDFLKHVNKKTSRVHQDIYQVLSTGRISSSRPNLLQIPSKGLIAKEIRSCFIPRSGYVLVGGDYSSCELKLLAESSNDPVWIKEFLGEGKVHDKVACMMFDITMDKVEECPEWLYGFSYRDVAKNLDFGLSYGMSEFKLAATLQVSVEDAKNLMTKFFTTFPAIKANLDSYGLFGKVNGYIRTGEPYPRIRQFPLWKTIEKRIHKDKEGKIINVTSKSPKGFAILGEIERASMNMPFQGGNGNLIKLALIELRDIIKTNNYPVFIINSIYDEIVTECKEEFAEEWKPIMESIMVNCGKIFVKSIPMSIACKIMKAWEK